MTAAERARRLVDEWLGPVGYNLLNWPNANRAPVDDLVGRIAMTLLAHEAEVRAEYVCKCEKHGKGVSLPLPCPFCIEAEVREECIRAVCEHCRRGVLFVEYEDGDHIAAHIWHRGQGIETRGGCYGQAIRDSGREKERK